MTEQEHLLTCLAEECSEVQMAVAKALRFGLDDGYPGTTRTNLGDIVAELNDLEGIVAILRDLYDFPETDKLAVMQKRLKVGRHMEYAKTRGTLTENEKGVGPSGADDRSVLP